MDPVTIEGVAFTPLKIIPNPKGDIYHAMKTGDPGYAGFGEAYFSRVEHGAVKAWKKHTRMTLNLVVPVGEVRFVICDDRRGSKTRGKSCDVKLCRENYGRLTICPNLWVGFQGVGNGLNMVLNMASIQHDPEECISSDVAPFPFRWDDVS